MIFLCQENDTIHQKQKLEGSMFSLRTRSVLSLVYGEQDVVLDDTIHKAMFDQTTVENGNNALTLTQSESISVFQIRQGPHEISATSKTPTNNNGREEREKRIKKCCSCCGAGISSKCNFWGPFRKRVKRVVESKAFEAAIIFIILINTLFMSIQYHGMDEDLEKAIDIVNSVSDLYVSHMDVIVRYHPLPSPMLRFFCSRPNVCAVKKRITRKPPTETVTTQAISVQDVRCSNGVIKQFLVIFARFYLLVKVCLQC